MQQRYNIASVYNKGAFVGVMDVQINSIKIQGINQVKKIQQAVRQHTLPQNDSYIRGTLLFT
jgi:hypothetical protein